MFRNDSQTNAYTYLGEMRFLWKSDRHFWHVEFKSVLLVETGLHPLKGERNWKRYIEVLEHCLEDKISESYSRGKEANNEGEKAFSIEGSYAGVVSDLPRV